MATKKKNGGNRGNNKKGMAPTRKPTRKRDGPLPEPTDEQVREYQKKHGNL